MANATTTGYSLRVRLDPELRQTLAALVESYQREQAHLRWDQSSVLRELIVSEARRRKIDVGRGK